MQTTSNCEFVLNANFLIGDSVLDADLSCLDSLSEGDYAYFDIIDPICTETIKIEIMVGELAVTRAQCGSVECDLQSGACIKPSKVCERVVVNTELPCFEITSTTLNIEDISDEDCTKFKINISDGFDPFDCIPIKQMLPGFSIPFIANNEWSCILFEDLCAELSACHSGGDTTNIIQEITETIAGSGFNGSFCGLAIEDGIIQNAPPDWCDQFATVQALSDSIAVLAEAISEIDVGVQSVQFESPLSLSGTNENPVVGISETSLQDLTQIELNSANETVEITSTSANKYDLSANQAIEARWSGSLDGIESYSNNIVVSVGADDLCFTFNFAMPNVYYFVSITDQNGAAVTTTISNKTINGFCIPKDTINITLYVRA